MDGNEPAPAVSHGCEKVQLKRLLQKQREARMSGQHDRRLAEPSPDLRKDESAQSYTQWRQAFLKLQLSRDSHLAADCFRRCSALLSHLVDSNLVTSVEEAAMRAELKKAWLAAIERVS